MNAIALLISHGTDRVLFQRCSECIALNDELWRADCTRVQCNTPATAGRANAAVDIYEITGMSRKISVAFVQPVEHVAVHIVGVNGRGCTAPQQFVYSMNFIPRQQVKQDRSLSAKLQGSFRGANGEIEAANQRSATSSTPAVFSFSFTNPSLRAVKYNIVYTRNGQSFSQGWRPDAGGGCTYPL